MSDTSVQALRGSYLMPPLSRATVGDAMHLGIISCDAETSLAEIARLMAIHHVHCIAVMAPSHGVDGGDLVWGLLTDLGLIRAGLRLGSDQSAARALANEPVMSIRPTMPLRQAAEKMLEHGVNHMIVIDPETRRPIGVLSTLDIVRVLAWGEG